MVGHQIRHGVSVPCSVDLDDTNVQPFGVTHRILGDQPVTRDPVSLSEFRVADVVPERAGAW